MRWFRNLPLFLKISLIVAIAVATLAINTSLNASGTLAVQKDLALLEDRIYQTVQLATINSILLKRSDELFTQAVSFDDQELKVKATRPLRDLKNNLRDLKSLNADHRKRLNELERGIEKYSALSVNIVDQMLSGDPDFSKIGALAEQKTQLFEQTNERLDQYKAAVDEWFMKTISHSRTQGEDNLKFSLIFGILLTSMMLAVALSVARSISKTASNLSDSLHEFAEGEGNLNHRIHVSSSDELGKLAHNFNRFIETLSNSVQQVLQVSKPLASMSSNLLSTSTSARNLLEQQAQNAQRMGDSIGEFRNSIQENTQSAVEAKSEVNESKNEIQNSLRIVEKTIANSVEFGQQIDQAANSVKDLAEDTNSVNSILDVIKSIAEQTNLLALNAAIEAARAGEQGRGFAVVADEVRSLASRTGDATTEIFGVLEKLRSNAEQSVTMMTQSQQKSEVNEEYARETGEALEKIRSRIDSITLLNERIAASTEEQNHVIDGILDTVQVMNQSVNYCSDSFTQLDSIANQLHQASDELTTATGLFKL